MPCAMYSFSASHKSVSISRHSTGSRSPLHFPSLDVTVLVTVDDPVDVAVDVAVDVWDDVAVLETVDDAVIVTVDVAV